MQTTITVPMLGNKQVLLTSNVKEIFSGKRVMIERAITVEFEGRSEKIPYPPKTNFKEQVTEKIHIEALYRFLSGAIKYYEAILGEAFNDSSDARADLGKNYDLYNSWLEKARQLFNAKIEVIADIRSFLRESL